MNQIRNSYYAQTSKNPSIQLKRWNRQLVTDQKSSQYQLKKHKSSSLFKKFETNNQHLHQFDFARSSQFCLESSKKILEQRKRNGTLSLNKQIGISTGQNYQLNSMQFKKNFGLTAISNIFRNQQGKVLFESCQILAPHEKSLFNKKLKELQKLTTELNVLSFKLHRILDDTKLMIKDYFSQISHSIQFAMKQFLQYQMIKINKTVGQQSKGFRLKRRIMSKTSLCNYSEQGSPIPFRNNSPGGLSRNQSPRSPKSPMSHTKSQASEQSLKSFAKKIEKHDQILQHEHENNDNSKDLQKIQQLDEQMKKKQLFHSQEIILKDKKKPTHNSHHTKR